MKSHKKLQLSRETLRDLTSDLGAEQLGGVRGGENASVNTCLDCPTTTLIYFSPTWFSDDCWPATR